MSENHNKNRRLRREEKKGRRRRPRKLWVALICCAAALAALTALIITLSVADFSEEVSYNEFRTMADQEQVEKITFDEEGSEFTFRKKDDDKTYKTDNPKIDGFKEEMLKKNIEFEEVSTPIWLIILSYVLPYLPFAVIVFILFRMIPGIGGKFSVDAASRPETTFDDVAGLEEIKTDMKTIAETLKDPSLCKELGAHMTKGVLLEGEPGNGKTLFARALAGETGVNFYSANASEFIEMYAGLGASRVRKLFKEAREHAPSVVFIDELDAIGSRRDGSTDGAGREYTQCLNALLAAIDGFEESDGVLVIGATNRSEDLDPALVRPGRFDKQFILPPPDCTAREQILRLHAKGKKFAPDVDLSVLAKDTVGFSGAGLEALLNEAAMIALTDKAPAITRGMIDRASLQMMLKGHIKNTIGDRNHQEHTIVSYHEAGHAVATLGLTQHDVRRVTVLPATSGAGGLTMSVPPADRSLPTVSDLENQVKMLYAGRAAEYLLSGEKEQGVTLGAAQDVKEATGVIQNLVSLTQKEGLLDYSDFGLAGQKKMMDLCEDASRRLWEETVAFAREHWTQIDRIAKALMEKETLSGEEVRDLYEETSK